jgi:hypothetical protein
VVLGAGGKMGPSLCGLAKRAIKEAGVDVEVVAVSRFRDGETRGWLESHGVRVIAVDLMDRESWRDLPDADRVVYLLGMKFGTSGRPHETWAMNALPPGYCVERYPRSKIVALSTGNVYALSPAPGRGANERSPLTPLGEYANACVARERLFEYHSLRLGTPVTLIRLNYAIDLRYGVLVDIGQTVMRKQPVSLAMGYFNCVWQGEANDRILRLVDEAKSPPEAINLTGIEPISIRNVATRFGERFGNSPHFVGEESETALLSDSSKLVERLGPLKIGVDDMIDWTADWLARGGKLLGKPTHFEVRDGKY